MFHVDIATPLEELASLKVSRGRPHFFSWRDFKIPKRSTTTPTPNTSRFYRLSKVSYSLKKLLLPRTVTDCHSSCSQASVDVTITQTFLPGNLATCPIARLSKSDSIPGCRGTGGMMSAISHCKFESMPGPFPKSLEKLLSQCWKDLQPRFWQPQLTNPDTLRHKVPILQQYRKILALYLHAVLRFRSSLVFAQGFVRLQDFCESGTSLVSSILAVAFASPCDEAAAVPPVLPVLAWTITLGMGGTFHTITQG